MDCLICFRTLVNQNFFFLWLLGKTYLDLLLISILYVLPFLTLKAKLPQCDRDSQCK